MLKRLSLAILLLAFAAGSVLAAASMKASVTSVEGKKVQLTLVGEKADWLKKGVPVKWKGGVGRVTEIAEDKITVNTKKADSLKVGDEVVLEKGPAALSGC